MKITILFSFLLILFYTVKSYAQPIGISTQRCIGGAQQDIGKKIIKGYPSTPPSYIIVGETKSDDGDILYNLGGWDIFWLKTDTSGGIFSEKIYGGSDDDVISDIIPGWNSDYILAGSSKSNDGNVSGNHGQMDVLIIDVDNYGVPQWQKCFGGTNYDYATSIIKTTDSCYVFSAWSMSNDGDISINHGLNTSDFWLVKIDRTGNIIWEKTYGGSNNDYSYNVKQTSDNGFIICGASYSVNGQVSGNHGTADFWIVKVDSFGNLQWQKCFGGSSLEEAYSVIELNTRYYILGENNSNNGDITGNHISGGTASIDVWLICVDSLGNLLWNKSLGGSDGEIGQELFYYNNYFFLGCYSSSNDGDVINRHANSEDYWIVQMDTTGNIIWENTYGGNDHEYLYSTLLDAPFLYSIGYCWSNDGDISGNHGFIDAWLLRLNINSLIDFAPSKIPTNVFEIYPNPFQSVINIRTTYPIKGKLYIKNDLGEVVFEDDYSSNQNVELGFLKVGVYFVSVQTTKEVFLGKVVKIK